MTPENVQSASTPSVSVRNADGLIAASPEPIGPPLSRRQPGTAGEHFHARQGSDVLNHQETTTPPVIERHSVSIASAFPEPPRSPVSTIAPVSPVPNETPEPVEWATVDPFPGTLGDDVRQAITIAYGVNALSSVFAEVCQRIADSRRERTETLLNEDALRPSDWYKSELVYMFYPERFGVDENGHPNTFRQLIPMLDYLCDLGVTTLYILPFLNSPLIDAGFDVSDFRQVRSDLGGNEEFEEFMKAAKQRGFRIKADLILNHVSDQHAWFQEALAGDPEKLDYFVHRSRLPKFRIIKSARKGVVAVYSEAPGVKSIRRLMFPDIVTSNYRKEVINGQDVFFYHTFYPHQPDLNWENPKILYESIEIMGFWANKGVDIFRMDAIPFFFKTIGTDGENRPETHAVVKILSACLQVMGPATVIQAEACQWPNDIRPYYGDDRQYINNVAPDVPKIMTRTNEVQIAYHFPFMPAIWASMVTSNPVSFWKAASATPSIPDSATWAIFLRVHDELTLEMVDPRTREIVYNALVPYGEAFREGLGVSGRLASFLNNDVRRIQLIYAILLSLPGIPILYFGDEIGINNSRDFMLRAATEREMRSGLDGAEVKSFVDTRDLGRAPIPKGRFEEAVHHPDTASGTIYSNLRRLIAMRKQEDLLSKGKLVKVQASVTNLFSYLRELDGRQMLMVHNLSGEAQSGSLRLPPHLQASNLAPESLLDLLSMQPMPFKINKRTNTIHLTLQAYQACWLKMNLPTSAMNIIGNTQTMA